MSVLGLAFEMAATGSMASLGTHPSPIEALVSHVSNIGNPTTSGPGGIK